MVIQKNPKKPAFTLSEKNILSFNLSKKNPCFPAEEKKDGLTKNPPQKFKWSVPYVEK